MWYNIKLTDKNKNQGEKNKTYRITEFLSE